MSTSFKTSMFGGFDRSDVIAYIERTGREYEDVWRRWSGERDPPEGEPDAGEYPAGEHRRSC